MAEQHQTEWHFDVLRDIAQALRRDNLHETAEMIDDAAQVLAQEQAMLVEARRKCVEQPQTPVLRLVKPG